MNYEVENVRFVIDNSARPWYSPRHVIFTGTPNPQNSFFWYERHISTRDGYCYLFNSFGFQEIIFSVFLVVFVNWTMPDIC